MSRNTIAECLKAIERVRDELTAQVEGLPDNPRSRRLGERAFVIQFKELWVTSNDAAGHKHSFSNWSPSFHDFRCQHRAIVAVLKQGAPQDCYGKLERAVGQGYLDDRDKTRLHPDVVEKLRGMLEEAA